MSDSIPQFVRRNPRDSIVRGFATLRTTCDPRGLDLLDALEEMALGMHDMLHDATPPSPGHSRHWSLPDVDGLPLDSPKLHVLREADEL